MKKHIALTFIALLVYSACGLAQGLMKFDMHELKRENNRVFYSYAVQIGAKAINSSQALRISPRLELGSKIYPFTPITVIGSNKNEVIRRWRNNHHLAKDTIVTLVNQEADTVLNFSGYLPYETWMKNGEVIVTHEIMGYRGESTVTTITLKVGIEPNDPIEPTQEAVVTEATNVQEKELLLSNMNFERGCAIIAIDYRNNAEEKRRLDEFIKKLVDDKNLSVEKVSIKAYASPEGTYAQNERLADKRAQELMQYLMSKTHLPQDRFECESVAEDWEGLEKMIEVSDVPDKEKVLEIIHSTGIFEGRETKLMNLNHGEPYNFMLKNLFPELRRTTCKITYSKKR